MALFKYEQHVNQSQDPLFDEIFEPGDPTIFPGIYKCMNCGDEIGIAKGHRLPPQDHHQHPPRVGPIRWRLLVLSEQVN